MTPLDIRESRISPTDQEDQYTPCPPILNEQLQSDTSDQATSGITQPEANDNTSEYAAGTTDTCSDIIGRVDSTSPEETIEIHHQINDEEVISRCGDTSSEQLPNESRDISSFDHDVSEAMVTGVEDEITEKADDSLHTMDHEELRGSCTAFSDGTVSEDTELTVLVNEEVVEETAVVEKQIEETVVRGTEKEAESEMEANEGIKEFESKRATDIDLKELTPENMRETDSGDLVSEEVLRTMIKELEPQEGMMTHGDGLEPEEICEQPQLEVGIENMQLHTISSDENVMECGAMELKIEPQIATHTQAVLSSTPEISSSNTSNSNEYYIEDTISEGDDNEDQYKTPAAVRPLLQRQLSETDELAERVEESCMVDAIGDNYERFSQFHQDNSFQILEVISSSFQIILISRHLYRKYLNCRVRIVRPIYYDDAYTFLSRTEFLSRTCSKSSHSLLRSNTEIMEISHLPRKTTRNLFTIPRIRISRFLLRSVIFRGFFCDPP